MERLPTGTANVEGADLITRRREPWWALPSAVVLTAITLALDIILPRGASADILFCAAVLLAAATARLSILLTFSCICSALTILGYFLEPLGAPQWMSIFDRTIVIAVIWLTAVLGWRRLRIAEELRRQAQILENTTKQLARSNADLERFSTVVSHDLRSPLSALGLNLEILRRQIRSADDDPSKTIADMQTIIADMGALIAGLLEHGRATQQQLDLRACDVEELLGTVLKRLSAALHSSGGRVTFESLPRVRADQGQLMSLLQNLIENAIKYRSDRPPHIHIAAEDEGDFWSFSVRDNGIGISAAKQEKVFSIFQRGDSSRGGVGVGLAVCKAIVERHGGRIWLESNPGEGSTFHFTMPKAREVESMREEKLPLAQTA
jgi:signal transduction histidine kinase